MLISDVTTFVVGNPPPRHGGRYFIFVKLTTDDGIDGIGEAYVATVGPHVVADMIVDVAERHLVDRQLEVPLLVGQILHQFHGLFFSLVFPYQSHKHQVF